jgi:CrcB protein
VTAIAFVAIAAAATLVRAAVTADQPGGEIPWRTLALNCAGALLLGVLLAARPESSLLLGTAGLGSLTTFSTVAAETAALLDDGKRQTAIAYLVLTVVVGVAAAWLGLSIGDSL